MQIATRPQLRGKLNQPISRSIPLWGTSRRRRFLGCYHFALAQIVSGPAVRQKNVKITEKSHVQMSFLSLKNMRFTFRVGCCEFTDC